MLRLPYLGATKDNEVCEYLLLKISPRSALIAIPHWVMNRTTLHRNDNFNLFLNNYFYDRKTSTKSLEGTVTPIESYHSGFGNLYKIQFEKTLEAHYLFSKMHKTIDFESSFLELIKDSLFLKNGIYVYVKHLIPFFSRILKISKSRYNSVKDMMLLDIHSHILAHIIQLETLYNALKSTSIELYQQVDLEKLREITQSEINKQLFEITFDSLDEIKKTKEERSELYSIRSYHVYLDAIKTLEERLYTNYNNLVILYSKFSA